MGREHGQIHWTELNTRDPQKASAYYAAVLGWTIAEMPMPGGAGTYRIGMRGEEPVAGIFVMDGPELDGAPEHWLTYFAVEDIQATIAAVEAAGGMVMRPPFDVPGVGEILLTRDATGAMVGMMKPAPEG